MASQAASIAPMTLPEPADDTAFLAEVRGFLALALTPELRVLTR